MGQGSGEKARENINMLEAEFEVGILRKNDFLLHVALVSPTSALHSGKCGKVEYLFKLDPNTPRWGEKGNKHRLLPSTFHKILITPTRIVISEVFAILEII